MSIIVPIYNMEMYLPKCLASLQRQNFGDEVEILLLDDGSQDSSGNICDKIAIEDSHFRVFHQTNRGVAATRNRGLREAWGEYIAWVDPDDYITDDWWQVIAPVLAKQPEMVYFDMTELKDGQFTDKHFDTESRVIEHDELVHELARDRIPSQCWSKILRRDFFDGDKTFDENLSFWEDFRMMHRITFPVRQCVYLHNCLYVYRQLETSIVHDREKELANAWLGVEVTRERVQFYREHQIANVSEFACVYRSFLFCMVYYLHSERKIAIEADMHKRYPQCIHYLKANAQVLFQSDLLTVKDKLYLFLLTHHLMSLHRLVPVVKKILKRN